MSNTLKTALNGGGRIVITINVWANGDFHLHVTEDWAKLTAPRQAVVTAAQMNAAEDPDGLIREELTRLVAAAHINYEARK